jgi:glycosyltransferase involved in cell wall biosynthesis
MISLTALILTYNEKENIARTLGALAWVQRIVIIDSFSDDGTLELVASIRPDAAILQRPFRSFAEQCNFGLTQIETEWVLSIDADYILTPELVSEMQRLESAQAVAGYQAEFNYCVFGRRLRTTIYPQRTVLYRRSAAEYVDEGHGHRVRISGLVCGLSGRIDHDDRKPLSRWIRSQDAYSKVEAAHLLATAPKSLSKQDRLRLRVYFAPAVVFIYLLLAKGLVLDGWPGWYYVFQRTIAEMLLSLRLLTERHRLESDAPADVS